MSQGDGWVGVEVGDVGFVLDDPDTCTGVADEHDDDDEQVEPLVFPSPEDAYAAFTWSMAVGQDLVSAAGGGVEAATQRRGHAQRCMRRPTVPGEAVSVPIG